MSAMNACRLCGSHELRDVLDLGAMPIAHRLLERADSDEERFAFVISVCTRCGHAQILDPVPPAVLYNGFNYNFSSWKPEPHFDDEVETVLSTATPESVLDVGANDGRWLAALRERDVPIAVGIEPNHVPARIAVERGLRIHDGVLDAAMARTVIAEHGRFSLVSARQVVEHVTDLATFLDAAHALVRDDGWLFVDVPDFAAARMSGDCSVLWEEHVSYFTVQTLAALLRRHGFEPAAIRTYNFSGGTVAMLAQRCARASAFIPPATAAADVSAATRFGERARAYAVRLDAALARARAAGAKVAMYGAGVRACTGVNGMRLGARIDVALDDQVERQGKFLPGARLPIRSVETLRAAEQPIVCVLAVNNENEARVRARLDAVVGRPVTYVSPCAPNDIWGELERLEHVSWN